MSPQENQPQAMGSPDFEIALGLEDAFEGAEPVAEPPAPVHAQLGEGTALILRARRLTRDPFQGVVVRMALARALSPPAPARWSESQLLRIVVPRLVRGELLARPAAILPPRSMLVAEPKEAPPPVAPAPPTEEKKPALAWIEVQLVDGKDKPRKGERYRLKLPDGQVREGKLNDNGLVRASDVPTGSCEICFPDIDASEWEQV